MYIFSYGKGDDGPETWEENGGYETIGPSNNDETTDWTNRSDGR